MTTSHQTPGVYINEAAGFSAQVVAVPTAVPVFIGYTEIASDGKNSLTGKAVPLSSMLEFLNYFADPAANHGAPSPRFFYPSPDAKTVPPCAFDAANPRFNLYYAVQMFFANGGGQCYVLSLGSYEDGTKALATDVYDRAWLELATVADVTIVVMPDSVLLPAADWQRVCTQALMHCHEMASRVAVLDIRNGYLPADGTVNDPIKGADAASGFYGVGTLGEEFNKNGVAYYPWLNTSLAPLSAVDFRYLNDSGIGQLRNALLAESSSLFLAPAQLTAYRKLLDGLAPGATAADATALHAQLLAASPLYQQTMQQLADSVNLLPPGGAMAGVYKRIDDTFGVWSAPANTGIVGAVSPSVVLSDGDQMGLNTPINGVAVNAIRSFPNSGLLVWGARTMAGNSDDWRYINVRRTMIMLEQSIKVAMQAYAFQANDALTWNAVQSAISDFLTAQWQAGALRGAKPADAYNVGVGLGTTMTGDDLMNGIMNVTVGVAVVHPAEFIVMTFQQQMQTAGSN